ncbi:hypothetical protein D5R81_14740 [Parashewanella spongiae]|uniref:Uncharacterized protein n=1 Tax=Parashewanella spongiae TaxID=342950 RepID=A0A3A6U3H8_9GAMM|nr:hypothetical protein [Parashewanella spongiae]MCL1079213.1 hypothetical protein [Parashewanella spongiae]RJY10443.1 hypothetical protein D5R81_14740 [Parashewanella spongiae]
MSFIALALLLIAMFLIRKQLFIPAIRFALIGALILSAALILVTTLGVAPAIVLVLACLMLSGIVITSIVSKL